MFHPFSYQEECLSALTSVREEGAESALVVMASGLGKTVTVAFDVKNWLQSGGRGRVMYLCHQNEILNQAKTTLQAVIGSDKSYGFFHGQEKNLHEVDFLFASFQTMEKCFKVFDQNEFAYIVVDESHHSHADTYRKVIKYFQPKFLLGVTATPNRHDQKDIREIYGSEIYYLPLEEALARNLLTPVDYRFLSDEIVLNGVLNTPKGKLSVAYLNRKIFIPRRDEEIARIIEKHVSELADPRVIIFCATVKHCDHFCAHVPTSLAIHSKISIKERIVRLELFRQGIVNTIVTVDCFNEGIDIPQANVVVFLRSTASPTIFLQQLGRGLRKSTGKDKVIALDFIGNCERINILYDLMRAVKTERELLEKRREYDLAKIEPMTLNIDQSNFSERIIQVIELLDKLKPKMISDFPHLLVEYSPKNPMPASLVVAGTNRKIWWKCSLCEHEWQAKGSSRIRGTGCPGCKNLAITSVNNLAVTHLDLAKEYLPPPKNTKPASEVIAGSPKKFWWKCSVCTHEWEATGNSRINMRSGCPACAGKAVTPDNNLSVKYPELAEEYMPPPRNKLPADQVTTGHCSKVWWKCSVCTHEWEATAIKRRGGRGCPKCSHQRNYANLSGKGKE